MTMKQTTDLAKVKEQAITFLYLEPEPKAGIDFLIDYPYLDTPFGYLKATGRMFNVFSDDEVFEDWKKEMVDFIQSRGTITDIMVLFTKPYRLVFFKYISEYLDIVDFTKQFKDIYTSIEFPCRTLCISDLSFYFKVCDKDLLMDKFERMAYDMLPDVVKVYRGVSSDEYMVGFSWTLDREKAQWFAERLAFEGSKPVVYSTSVSKDDIIAYFGDRREEEIIILPETFTKYKIDCLYL